MKTTRLSGLLLAIAAPGLWVLSGAAAPGELQQAERVHRSAVASSLIGTARSKDGIPLEGVVISARAAGKSYSTSVFSDAKGEYVFPPLESGRYDVWAQAVGFDTTRAELTVGHSRQARQTFTLSPIADITPHVSGSEWMAALPADTKEQRRAKEIFRTNCTACHSPTYALQNRFDENGWRAVIMFMERNTGTGGINRHSTVVHHRDDLARYLAEVRGPLSPPLKFKLQPRPTGDATRVVVTEYDIPLAGRGPSARGTTAATGRSDGRPPP